MMRAKNIIHRDLKPGNIFIKYNSKNTKDFTIKLGDFGLSRQFNNNNFSTVAGTKNFMSPEQFNPNYDPNKCDLWSIGVIIYKLKFNEIPFSFISGEIPSKFKEEKLNDLIKKLIVVKPEQRINWEDYFEHPFFK